MKMVPQLYTENSSRVKREEEIANLLTLDNNSCASLFPFFLGRLLLRRGTDGNRLTLRPDMLASGVSQGPTAPVMVGPA